MDRPSFRELNAKLKEAREAAAAGKFRLLESDAILADLFDLDLLVKDLGKQLPRIIEEINPRDYKGRRPPVPSYEKPILNLELFPFRWKSKTSGCFM
jgi:hypothetical protein